MSRSSSVEGAGREVRCGNGDEGWAVEGWVVEGWTVEGWAVGVR